MKKKKNRKPRSLIGRVIKSLISLSLIIILIGIALIGYAYKIEPYLLTVNNIELTKEPTGDTKIRLVLFSDLELSENYTAKELTNLTAKINECNPDIVIFTGDLFSNYSKYRPVTEVEAALGAITATSGKYAIYGNNDYGGGAIRHYQEIMETAGFTLLKNQSELITLDNGKSIFLGGLDDSSFSQPDLEETLADISENSYNILLSHKPIPQAQLDNRGVDLILSGHTHGGQVRLPFKELQPYPTEYIRGLYPPSSQTEPYLFISNGLGTSRLPIRFLVPPQITLFEIQL